MTAVRALTGGGVAEAAPYGDKLIVFNWSH